MENKDNLLGVLRAIFKWKKYIIYTCVAVGIGALVTSLLVPVYYESTTVFYAASPDLADPSKLYGRANTNTDYYGVKEDIDRIMSIAKSNDLADFLINTFNLYEHYDIDTAHHKADYNIRLHLASLYNVKRTKEDAIELSIEDENKEMAAQMVNAARNRINEIGQHLIRESLKLTVETYKKSIKEGEAKLDTLSNQLRVLRDSFGVYNVETQSDILTGQVASAQNNLLSTSIKLEVLQSMNRASLKDSIILLQATKKAQEARVKALDDKLELFNKGLDRAGVLTEVQLEASEQMGKDRERFRQILSVYESKFPAIHVLEEGAIPNIKSRPKRMIICLVAVLLAFILSVVGVLIFDTYRDVNWKAMYRGEEYAVGSRQ